mgnify:CR=1 FL=1
MEIIMKYFKGKISSEASKMCLTLFVAFCLNMNGYAAFIDSGFGARTAAMGQAFTAVSGDVNSLLVNPASLATLKYPEISALYGRMYMGLEDDSKIGQNYFIFASPLGQYLPGIVAFAWQEVSLSGYYSESSFVLSYSTRVKTGLFAGGNLKMLRVSYESDVYTEADPLFNNGYSKSALALDVGAIYKLSKKYNVGLAIKNLNQPDTGIEGNNKVPIQIRLGAAYVKPENIFDFDVSYCDSDYDFSLGAERWINSRFALRMGILAGKNARRNFNLGFGGRHSNFQMDYSFTLPLGGIRSTSGLHKLSFSMRFGPSYAASFPATPKDMKGVLNRIEETMRMMNESREKAKRQEAQILELERKLKKQDEMMKRVVSPVSSLPVSTSQDIDVKISLLRKELENSRREIMVFKNKIAELEKKYSAGKKVSRPVRKPKIKKPKENIYVVKKGDTLKSVAQKIYGDTSKWIEIYKANSSKIGRGGEIKKGQILILP